MRHRLFVMSLSLFAPAAAGFGALPDMTQARWFCIDPAPILKAPMRARRLRCRRPVLRVPQLIGAPTPTIDPNPLVASGPRQTHQGFALAGYEAGNGGSALRAPDPPWGAGMSRRSAATAASSRRPGLRRRWCDAF